MKNKNNIFFLIIASAGILLSSCKKYEEGPALSLRTKTARLANEWRYDKVISSSGNVVTSSYENLTITFQTNGVYKLTSTTQQTTITTNGKWEFEEGKEKIKITYTNGDVNTLIIRKLKNKEFWYEDDDYSFFCEPAK